MLQAVSCPKILHHKNTFPYYNPEALQTLSAFSDDGCGSWRSLRRSLAGFRGFFLWKPPLATLPEPSQFLHFVSSSVSLAAVFLLPGSALFGAAKGLTEAIKKFLVLQRGIRCAEKASEATLEEVFCMRIGNRDEKRFWHSATVVLSGSYGRGRAENHSDAWRSGAFPTSTHIPPFNLYVSSNWFFGVVICPWDELTKDGMVRQSMVRLVLLNGRTHDDCRERTALK